MLETQAAVLPAILQRFLIVGVCLKVGGALGEELQELQEACLSMRRSNEVSTNAEQYNAPIFRITDLVLPPCHGS